MYAKSLKNYLNRFTYTSLNFQYTLKYEEGIDKEVREYLINGSETLIEDLNKAFYEEVVKIKKLRHFYFRINYHNFFITKGSDEIQGLLSITIQWISIISDVGGAVAFIAMLKKALQSTFFGKTKELPDKLAVFEIANHPGNNNTILQSNTDKGKGKKKRNRPLGSGIFAMFMGLIFFTVYYNLQLGIFKLTLHDIQPEFLLKIWLIFSFVVLGGWGFNRILNSDGRWIVGQDTIKLVLAFMGATIAIISLLLKT